MTSALRSIFGADGAGAGRFGDGVSACDCGSGGSRLEASAATGDVSSKSRGGGASKSFADSKSKSGTVSAGCSDAIAGVTSAVVSGAVCGAVSSIVGSRPASAAGSPASTSASAAMRRSAPSISVLILSQTSGGGSTASTMTLSSPSRRSHTRTISAKPGSITSNASAWSRSSAESVPKTYSAARASRSSSYIATSRHSSNAYGLASNAHDLERKPESAWSGSCAVSHTLAQFEETATQPSLDRVHRNIELLRQLIAAPAAVIGQQHDALLFRIELAETGEQSPELLGHLAAGQRRRRVG